MLISDLIRNSNGGGSTDKIDSVSSEILSDIKFQLPSNEAIFDGLRTELSMLINRFCTPLKSAHEHHFNNISEWSLTHWLRSYLKNCVAFDRVLYQQVAQLIEEYLLLEARLEKDLKSLRDEGFISRDSVLKAVNVASADKHHGLHVLELKFTSSEMVFYKPRTGDGSKLLSNISSLFLDNGLPLLSPRSLVFSGYHWMEGVTYQPLLSESDAKNFAFCGGVLYGVAGVLNSSDLHFENIMATLHGPIVIDCETICQPRFSKIAESYLLKRERDEFHDISSLFFNHDKYDDLDLDYGGLSCVDFYFRPDPYSGLQVRLSSEHRELALYKSKSAVEVNGARIAPAVEYFEYFSKGIRLANDFLAENKQDILNLISPELVFRVPIRATRVYAGLLSERMSATYFSSYSDNSWSSFMEQDLKTADGKFRASAEMIYQKEKIDLANLNIPAAYVQANSRSLLFEGDNIPHIFDSSPIEVVNQRLQRLTSKVTEHQISTLRDRF
ncbi:DUF4135 domain-containing protein [Agaribacterium haliotis]|uniref:DUF4135 domain-containing protein n=1 Tax=Agaribacterium haliotis TaxID=2013869 RepID=UPI000BB558DB|nr:DUF4135 domain-containing protein [Agaribacterium haliotis]